MGENSLKALLKGMGVATLSIVSILGILSIFSINVAGFLLLLPRPLWPLIDVQFISSFLARFSVFIAVSFLFARYSTDIASAVAGAGYSFLNLAMHLHKKEFRRLLRKKGYLELQSFARSLHEAEEKYQYDYQREQRLFRSNKSLHHLVGAFYFLGEKNGKIEAVVDRWGSALQVLSAASILSVLYLEPKDAILLTMVFYLLLAHFPPSFWSLYFSKPYLYHGINPLQILRIKFLDVVTPGKVSVIALSLSFLLGLLHHLSLLDPSIKISAANESSVDASIIAITNNGLILHNEEIGYWYIESLGSATLVATDIKVMK